MKITKKILQDIIKEELEKVVLSESSLDFSQSYEKEIKMLIAANGVEYALQYLAYMVGQNKDSLKDLEKRFAILAKRTLRP